MSVKYINTDRENLTRLTQKLSAANTLYLKKNVQEFH